MLTAGENCWRVGRASKAALLPEGEAYFLAAAQSMAGARDRIRLAGWDFDSRVRLWRGDTPPVLPEAPSQLGPYLAHLVRRTPTLVVEILLWRYSLLYAPSREPLLFHRPDWLRHPRIRFRMDDDYPMGGSHHQKFLVCDGRVAFCGGLDMAPGRWDTERHEADDPRRVDARTGRYPPYHDAMLVFEGTPAIWLDELFRHRWWRGTGDRLAPAKRSGDAWPVSVEPWFTKIRMGLARTDPDFKGRPEVREVERLDVDLIKAARRRLYIENQYFTAEPILHALGERLLEEDGPEIMIVLPERCQDLLQRSTMDAMRREAVAFLRHRDKYGRLSLVYPDKADLGKKWVNVHAKLMVVDDRWLRVGSSNLNYRSMGLDTECDAVLDAENRFEAREMVEYARRRLLGIHLGVSPEAFRKAEEEAGSMAGAADRLGGSRRRLRSFDTPEEAGGETRSWLLDPSKPLLVDRVMDAWVLGGGEGTPYRHLIRLGLAAGVVGWLALHGAPQQPGFPQAVLLLTLAGLAFTPLQMVSGAASVFFPLGHALGLSWIGCLLAGLIGFGFGRLLGADRLSGLMGRKLEKLHRHVDRDPVSSAAVARLVSLDTYTSVSLAFGAGPSSLPAYMAGTAVGVVPGIVFANCLGALLAGLHAGFDWALLLLILLWAVGAGEYAVWLRRRLAGYDRGEPPP
ncbi:phospholipase D-like domain-containing protein [Desulfohalovibrio reitneri]|uniref:phospholipase D-like domain-containing protein n=1 Tax=Desulfohalovibrio reitneri TaxID=1307759 RepID=UPI0004A773E2|nr:phospholipase D-like domain-containing protein [Desulfohalovibrio reitneri]